MSATAEFIQNNFKSITVLNAGANGVTELVTDSTNAVYIRKTVNGTGLPYRALAQMNINGLPKIYYCAEADGKTYVVEEYINGVNLQDELEQGRVFTEKQVLQIGLQLCDVLLAIHNKGILHRDIKPGNIILQNSSAWLIDFGAAKTVSGSKTQDTRILGTPGFAPPEQYGFGQSDMRSDIYALGVTLYEARTGKPYEKMERCGGKLWALIDKCTNLDVKKRYQSVKSLQRALQRLARKERIWAGLGSFLMGAIAAAAIFCLVLLPRSFSSSFIVIYFIVSCKFGIIIFSRAVKSSSR